MVICLERDADLHMAQLMPLPPTVSCFSKIQIGFTFLIAAHPGRPLNGCVCTLYNAGEAADDIGDGLVGGRGRRSRSR